MCVGCQQACLGHVTNGLPVGCIQNAYTGRELDWRSTPPIERPKRVAVVGGGPAGMAVATQAARRGHHVILWERHAELGGQVLTARARR